VVRASQLRHLIETSRELRLRRELERDGEHVLDDWEFWMAEEDAHYQRDPTRGELIPSSTAKPDRQPLWIDRTTAALKCAYYWR
jgi:hypothetical protein